MLDWHNIDHYIPLVLYSLILILLYIDQMVISNTVVDSTYHIAVVVMFYIVVAAMFCIVVVVTAVTTMVNNQFVYCIVNWIVFPRKDLLHMMHRVVHQIAVLMITRM